MSSVDEEFRIYTSCARSLILTISTEHDRLLATKWVQKLLKIEDPDQLRLRNLYLKLLLFFLNRGELLGPFSELPDPTAPLQDYPENYTIIEIAKLISSDAKNKPSDIDTEEPPLVAETSPDMHEYLSAQQIPYLGIHLYYAVSDKPVTNWRSPEFAILPKAASEDPLGNPPDLPARQTSASEPTLSPEATCSRMLTKRMLDKSATKSPPTQDPPTSSLDLIENIGDCENTNQFGAIDLEKFSECFEKKAESLYIQSETANQIYVAHTETSNGQSSPDEACSPSTSAGIQELRRLTEEIFEENLFDIEMLDFGEDSVSFGQEETSGDFVCPRDERSRSPHMPAQYFADQQLQRSNENDDACSARSPQRASEDQCRQVLESGTTASSQRRSRQGPHTPQQQPCPRIPTTPPVFSKHHLPPYPVYDPAEFGVDDDTQWIPGHKYFEDRQWSPKDQNRRNTVYERYSQIEPCSGEDFLGNVEQPNFDVILDDESIAEQIADESLLYQYVPSPPRDFHYNPPPSARNFVDLPWARRLTPATTQNVQPQPKDGTPTCRFREQPANQLVQSRRQRIQPQGRVRRRLDLNITPESPEPGKEFLHKIPMQHNLSNVTQQSQTPLSSCPHRAKLNAILAKQEEQRQQLEQPCEINLLDPHEFIPQSPQQKTDFLELSNGERLPPAMIPPPRRKDYLQYQPLPDYSLGDLDITKDDQLQNMSLSMSDDTSCSTPFRQPPSFILDQRSFSLGPTQPAEYREPLLEDTQFSFVDDSNVDRIQLSPSEKMEILKKSKRPCFASEFSQDDFSHNISVLSEPDYVDVDDIDISETDKISIVTKSRRPYFGEQSIGYAPQLSMESQPSFLDDLSFEDDGKCSYSTSVPPENEYNSVLPPQRTSPVKFASMNSRPSTGPAHLSHIPAADDIHYNVPQSAEKYIDFGLPSLRRYTPVQADRVCLRLPSPQETPKRTGPKIGRNKAARRLDLSISDQVSSPRQQYYDTCDKKQSPVECSPQNEFQFQDPQDARDFDIQGIDIGQENLGDISAPGSFYSSTINETQFSKPPSFILDQRNYTLSSANQDSTNLSKISCPNLSKEANISLSPDEKIAILAKSKRPVFAAEAPGYVDNLEDETEPSFNELIPETPDRLGPAQIRSPTCPVPVKTPKRSVSPKCDRHYNIPPSAANFTDLPYARRLTPVANQNTQQIQTGYTTPRKKMTQPCRRLDLNKTPPSPEIGKEFLHKIPMQRSVCQQQKRPTCSPNSYKARLDAILTKRDEERVVHQPDINLLDPDEFIPESPQHTPNLLDTSNRECLPRSLIPPPRQRDYLQFEVPPDYNLKDLSTTGDQVEDVSFPMSHLSSDFSTPSFILDQRRFPLPQQESSVGYLDNTYLSLVNDSAIENVQLSPRQRNEILAQSRRPYFTSSPIAGHEDEIGMETEPSFVDVDDFDLSETNKIEAINKCKRPYYGDSPIGYVEKLSMESAPSFAPDMSLEFADECPKDIAILTQQEIDTQLDSAAACRQRSAQGPRSLSGESDVDRFLIEIDKPGRQQGSKDLSRKPQGVPISISICDSPKSEVGKTKPQMLHIPPDDDIHYNIPESAKKYIDFGLPSLNRYTPAQTDRPCAPTNAAVETPRYKESAVCPRVPGRGRAKEPRRIDFSVSDRSQSPNRREPIQRQNSPICEEFGTGESLEGYEPQSDPQQFQSQQLDRDFNLEGIEFGEECLSNVSRPGTFLSSTLNETPFRSPPSFILDQRKYTTPPSAQDATNTTNLSGISCPSNLSRETNTSLSPDEKMAILAKSKRPLFNTEIAGYADNLLDESEPSFAESIPTYSRTSGPFKKMKSLEDQNICTPQRRHHGTPESAGNFEDLPWAQRLTPIATQKAQQLQTGYTTPRKKLNAPICGESSKRRRRISDNVSRKLDVNATPPSPEPGKELLHKVPMQRPEYPAQKRTTPPKNPGRERLNAVLAKHEEQRRRVERPQEINLLDPSDFIQQSSPDAPNLLDMSDKEYLPPALVAPPRQRDYLQFEVPPDYNLDEVNVTDANIGDISSPNTFQSSVCSTPYRDPPSFLLDQRRFSMRQQGSSEEYAGYLEDTQLSLANDSNVEKIQLSPTERRAILAQSWRPCFNNSIAQSPGPAIGQEEEPSFVDVNDVELSQSDEIAIINRCRRPYFGERSIGYTQQISMESAPSFVDEFPSYEQSSPQPMPQHRIAEMGSCPRVRSHSPQHKSANRNELQSDNERYLHKRIPSDDAHYKCPESAEKYEDFGLPSLRRYTPVNVSKPTCPSPQNQTPKRHERDPVQARRKIARRIDFNAADESQRSQEMQEPCPREQYNFYGSDLQGYEDEIANISAPASPHSTFDGTPFRQPPSFILDERSFRLDPNESDNRSDIFAMQEPASFQVSSVCTSGYENVTGDAPPQRRKQVRRETRSKTVETENVEFESTDVDNEEQLNYSNNTQTTSFLHPDDRNFKWLDRTL